MPSDPKTALTNHLDGISRFLDGSELFTLAEGEREALVRQAASIRERLRTIQEEMLCVGLLGGTGVGKSSLMNGLAGSQVASTSHRRPHTDKVLVYAHRDVALPDFLVASGVPFTELRHGIESVKHLLLCDLPDFDSLVGEHRQTVLDFLKHLDLLVWITSPEKYADRSFYDLLRSAPKAGPNFFFVLNKADQLVSAGHEASGFGQLQAVSGKFLEHLRAVLSERGEKPPRAESRTYIVSALKPGPAWNQFPLFREHLFFRRSLKQVSSIKAANLNQELRSLAGRLDRELAEARRCRDRLSQVIAALKEQQDWAASLEQPVKTWLETQVRPRLANHPSNLGLLLGPGRWIARLSMEWRRLATREEPDRALQVPDDVAAALQDRLQRLAHQISTQLLRHNLPERIRKRVDEDLDVPGESSRLLDQWQWFVRTAVEGYKAPTGRLFRLGQAAVYTALTGLFFLALGGQRAWIDLLRTPQVSDLQNLLFSLLQTTFSPTGLAALLSLLLLALLAGLRFFGRFRRMADKQTQGYAEAVAEQLLDSWQSQQKAVLKTLEGLREDLDSHAGAVSVLVEAELPEQAFSGH